MPDKEMDKPEAGNANIDSHVQIEFTSLTGESEEQIRDAMVDELLDTVDIDGRPTSPIDPHVYLDGCEYSEDWGVVDCRKGIAMVDVDIMRRSPQSEAFADF